MRRMSGFSLMEMMVVLLITAIVAAASAPMINKKLMHDQAESGSPWLYAGADNSIVYNVKGTEQTVSIGGVKKGIKTSLYLAKTGDSGLYIDVDDDNNNFNKPHVLLVDNNSGENPPLGIKYQSGGVYITTEKEENVLNGVIIGAGAKSRENSAILVSTVNATAIGGNTFASNNSVAVGTSASAGADAVAIGGADTSLNLNAKTQAGPDGVAVGSGAWAAGSSEGQPYASIAIGKTARAHGAPSIAIGHGANANHANSIAIGHGVETTLSNQIVLGTADDTVYIPGNLVVDRIAVLGAKGVDPFLSFYGDDDTIPKKIKKDTFLKAGADYNNNIPGYSVTSDRRLKNVGKAFVGGLEDVKKLEVFNYTYKKDPTKTPRVGVMAQDLEKIFPKAVFKGDDGFLRIRMEDMFYAVVNAIKELDSKFEALRNNEIKTLQKQVADLEKQNKELLKRIEKIEKNLK